MGVGTAAVELESQLVRPVAKLLAERGVSVVELLARNGLPASAGEERESRVPLAALRGFLEDAAVALAEPHLGLRVAERTPPGTWDLLEYSCRSAPNVREALRRMVRYVRLANQVVDIELGEQADGSGWVAQSLAGSPLFLGAPGNEFFPATLLLKCREYTGQPLTAECVWLAHPAGPDGADELGRFFGTDRVEFGCGKNGLVLDAVTLDTNLLSFDPALSAMLDRFANDALKARPTQSQLLHGLRESIRAQLVNGEATLAVTAKQLGVGARTLQRRLSDEETSFGAQVESVREELARLYVADRARPLAEVAYVLGYSDLSTFVRAFRRWTGTTPARFRGK